MVKERRKRPFSRGTSKEETYWLRVGQRDGCWGWKGYSQRSGYASLYWKGQWHFGHRVSWEIHYGPIPDGMLVCHRCDNPPCTNPEHLFLGTANDNNQDKIAKGRAKYGEKHPMAKLSSAQVIKIRERRAKGEKLKPLAEEFGVWPAAISRIVNGTRR